MRLFSSGKRWMQTLRKLPTVAPRIKMGGIQIYQGTFTIHILLPAPKILTLGDLQQNSLGHFFGGKAGSGDGYMSTSAVQRRAYAENLFNFGKTAERQGRPALIRGRILLHAVPNCLGVRIEPNN